ncbi:DUF899 family protein [Amycolatopsis sp. NBC_00438]|uniref:DUF899 family protein n=1 Tax=Amycolatopsis sp. NBC_00438 TaxID=2903558 RepID=UPI002E200486
MQGPCPSCTALLDQLDGAMEHFSPHADFAVVARAPIEHLLTFAAERGWRRLRLFSRAGTTSSRDYHAEVEDGSALPMLNVFHRGDDWIRHFWGSELLYEPAEPGQDPRHAGTIEPVWSLFDLTPRGRGPDWDEQLSYCSRRHFTAYARSTVCRTVFAPRGQPPHVRAADQHLVAAGAPSTR